MAGRQIGWAFFLAWAVSLQALAGYDVVSWRELSDRDLSALGRVVLRTNRRSWTHAESDLFIFHSADAQLLRGVAHEAEWCFREIGRRLGLNDSDQRARLFVFDSVAEWQQSIHLSARAGGERVAAYVGREIYIRRAPEDRVRYVDLAHELVHFRLWQEYGSRLPLWLDEGMAEYLGWHVAVAYHMQQRELRLFREQKVVAAGEWLPWDEFFQLQQYPRDPERNRVFYRQSDAVIRYLAERIGEDQLGELVRQVWAADGDIEAVLAQQWQWERVDWDAAIGF